MTKAASQGGGSGMPETTVMGLGLGMGIKMGVDGRFYASMGGVTMPSQVTN